MADMDLEQRVKALETNQKTLERNQRTLTVLVCAAVVVAMLALVGS